MKKVVILLVLVFSPFLLIKAQVKFGVEAGGVMNGVEASNLEGKMKFSYKVGGFMNYGRFNDYNLIESGVYYVRKDLQVWDFIPQYTDYIQNIKASMHYIELVPILFRVPAYEKSRTYFVFGLYGKLRFCRERNYFGWRHL